MRQADLAVVGGGASGLAAALAAAASGKRGSAVVLEKNPRVGKKLLLTGNGRCNLTNRGAGDGSHYHGDAGAREVLDRFPPERILELFQKAGLLCRELDGGRIYPYSLQASSVLNVLRRNLDRFGVEVLCGFDVKDIRKSDGGFLLSSPEGDLPARRVILAAGGSACPQSGSDGGGYSLAKALGHTVVPVYPSLAPVKTDPARVRPLKGVRCPVSAAFRTRGQVVRASAGEVQFTENALSGICIFELSRCFGDLRAPKDAEIALDLFSGYSLERVTGLLRAAAEGAGELSAPQLLEGFLPKALCVELSRYAFGGASGVLRREDLGRLASAAKDFRFPVRGTFSWDRAQVTAGGVPLSELTESLESKKCRGLYLCGELLDVDGDCGGFNLHWAWASGLAAGKAAADSLREKR
ncbi:NAD(P)/FAD-dependent oxidoreductase [Caproicibacter sp. BJN0012]|uniref:NAD(P)/FAD-dependent oxidoreductase n=1 Tax=Caproicibacter sp. BJN0012 TaxID=3110227 RepID=UPI002E157C89